MQLFLSWSGPKSQEYARALYDWIPDVIQSVKPYISSEGIESGQAWLNSITKALEGSPFGIICLTPENIMAPWIYFEAGAIFKATETNRIAPIIFDGTLGDLKEGNPLKNFQSSVFGRKQIRKLIHDINKNLPIGDGLPLERLDRLFNINFENLERKVSEISDNYKKVSEAKALDAEKTDRELIVDIHSKIRDLSQQRQSISPSLAGLLQESYDRLFDSIENYDIAEFDIDRFNNIIQSFNTLNRPLRLIMRESDTRFVSKSATIFAESAREILQDDFPPEEDLPF